MYFPRNWECQNLGISGGGGRVWTPPNHPPRYTIEWSTCVVCTAHHITSVGCLFYMSCHFLSCLLKRYQSMCSFVCITVFVGRNFTDFWVFQMVLWVVYCAQDYKICASCLLPRFQRRSQWCRIWFCFHPHVRGWGDKRWVGLKEGTVFSFRLIGSFIRQQVHWSETGILHKKLRFKWSFALFWIWGRNPVATGEIFACRW
jgi:hypothetical protein